MWYVASLGGEQAGESRIQREEGRARTCTFAIE